MHSYHIDLERDIAHSLKQKDMSLKELMLKDTTKRIGRESSNALFEKLRTGPGKGKGKLNLPK